MALEVRGLLLLVLAALLVALEPNDAASSPIECFAALCFLYCFSMLWKPIMEILVKIVHSRCCCCYCSSSRVNFGSISSFRERPMDQSSSVALRVAHSLSFLCDARANPSDLKHHESLLLSFSNEDINGYLNALCEVFFEKQGTYGGNEKESIESTRREESIRLAAALCMKTLVATKWKPRGGGVLRRTTSFPSSQASSQSPLATQQPPNLLTSETKNKFRHMIITTLRNQLPFPLTLPLQNSIQVLVAKIGRFDSIQEVRS